MIFEVDISHRFIVFAVLEWEAFVRSHSSTVSDIDPCYVEKKNRIHITDTHPLKHLYESKLFEIVELYQAIIRIGQPDFTASIIQEGEYEIIGNKQLTR